MADDTLALIYGRPFDVRLDRSLGGRLEHALDELAFHHPAMVHPPMPGSGEWWIGEEVVDLSNDRLPLEMDVLAPGMRSAPQCAAAVDSFLLSLPTLVSDHARLRPVGIYLVRRGLPRHSARHAKAA